MNRTTVVGCLYGLVLCLAAAHPCQRATDSPPQGDGSPQTRDKDPRGPSARPDLSMMWSRGQATGRGPVRLKHSPMKIEDIGSIIPMGLVVGAHVTPIDHMYFEPKDRAAGRFRYDVFAPADGVVVQIQHRVKFEGSSETQRDYDDWRVVIEHTGTFYAYYDLITKMEDAILDRMTADGPRKLNYSGRVPVKAGQLIGKIGGRTLDFAVVDTETKLKGFIVPEHYAHEPWKIHTVDPLDAFDEPVRGRLLALNPRKAEPRGGKIDYDIEGRLIGNWFRAGTNGYGGAGDPRGYWIGHLSFCYHHIDPSRIVVSIGDFAGRPRHFMVKGNGPDPAEISRDSGPVKYELVYTRIGSAGQTFDGIPTGVQGVLPVEMRNDRKLKVQPFPGKTAAQVQGFTAEASGYER